MNSLTQFKRTILSILVACVLGCFGLSPTARAVLPAPDGGYPNHNTAEGEDALFSLTTGAGNTAVGYISLYSNTTGGGNSAYGTLALHDNTTGFYNTANGLVALLDNTTGDQNTAAGAFALTANTTGSFNTAIGVEALENNTTGEANTATGVFALGSTTTGSDNTATGGLALSSNTTGDENTATGTFALYSNTTGYENTVNGSAALRDNTTGYYNTANGVAALLSNITGTRNTAFGRVTLLNNTSGSRNIALGYAAGFNLVTGDNNIDIGNQGVAAESGTIRIGTQGTQTATYIAGISGAGVMGVAVKVNAAGQLGTPPSAARFKEEIKPMDKASETILALKPVSFRYKKEIDSDGVPQFGLVAEDVEKVNPALVARDDQGKIYTVRYEAVNAMLLNEFLKEHCTVQEQKATIAQLKKDFAEQQKEIEALTTGLQKVSAQLAAASPSRGGLELSKPDRLAITK